MSSESYSQIDLGKRVILDSKGSNITYFTHYYSDTAGLKIIQIISLDSSSWSPVSHPAFITNKKNAIHYLKFNFITSVVSEDNFFVKLSNKGLNRVILYTVEEGKIIQADTTGDYFPFYKRPYLSQYFIFPIKNLADKKRTYYLSLDKRNENINVGLMLVNQKGLTDMENRLFYYLGLFIGILIIAFLTNLILFFILKDKLHIWYAFYVLSIILFIITYDSLDFRWIYPEHPFYANISRYIASSILLAFICYVMQLFVDQNKNNSRFYFFTNIIRYAVLLNVLFSFVVYYFYPFPLLKRLYFNYFLITQVLGIVITVVSCVEKVIQGYKPALFYLTAVSFLLFTGFLAILSEIRFIDLNKETPNMLQVGFIIELFLIFAGIMYKYFLFQNEYSLIQNELYELKVSSIKDTLQTQYAERKRIAEDLHDVFGSYLATIKLNVNELYDTSNSKQKLGESIDALSKITREITHNLIPSEIGTYDLFHLINQHLNNLNRHQQIHFTFTSLGSVTFIPKDFEYTIYKIFLELINNILKHSKATEANVQFYFKDEGGLQIMVEDNGIGMNKLANKGMGLENIKKRVYDLKGEIYIDSQSGNTSIIINLPSFDS